MKISNHYRMRRIGGASFAFPARSDTAGVIVRLNPTAAYLWGRLEKDCTRGELVAGILKEYRVDEDRAARDVDRFVASLRRYNLLE